MQFADDAEPRSNALRRTMPWNEILDSAADALITARCRNEYAHELRGSLHPISLAFELLLRASSSAAKKPELMEQATALTKRAMSVLEQSSLDLLKQITIADDAVRTTNLGELLDGVLRLLRADLDLKGIRCQVNTRSDVAVRAEAYRLRKTLLGLLALTIDELPQGAPMSVALMRSDGEARIEIVADIELPHIELSNALLTRGEAPTPYAIVLAASRQWLASRNGNLEIKRVRPAVIDLRYPLAIAAVAAGAGEIPPPVG